MSIQIKEIDNSNAQFFIELPYFIYKNDSEFIPHIEEDINAIFNSEQNDYLKD
jgi:hypothetical protein